MKLYYKPGACSLSPHIALREAGLPVELVKVDLRSKVTEDGRDYRTINPMGSVPLLELDGGDRLTEGPAIVQYIADRVPDRQLAPAPGTMARYRLAEWLNFIGTEIHKSFSPLFNPAMPEEAKQLARERLAKCFDHVEARLGEGPWLMGETFTVADGYLFTVLNWCNFVGIELPRWPGLSAFVKRAAARPAVLEALRAEGLAG
ncbi:glutathione transferase GstA [Caldimonas tepidiphila]|uniref:glutathione transferase GstA n=1 Tax=Caldimonas tepidiphila TaxID=2315841 RepID=UPI000E5A4F8F|nr:glutathione transferase GstA [Caldimonas tepidiphila]